LRERRHSHVAVFAADKIANVRELARTSAAQRDEPKNRAKLSHYHANRKMLHRAAPQLTLPDQLDAELERLVSAHRQSPSQAQRRICAPRRRVPISAELIAHPVRMRVASGGVVIGPDPHVHAG
jgi:hypothetical protein